MPSELWLFKSNPRCTQFFPGQEDCYTRDSLAPRPKMHLTTDQIEKSSRSNLRALAKKFPSLPLHSRQPKAQPKRSISCAICSSSLTLLLLTAFLVAIKDLSAYFSNKLPGASFPKVTGVSGLPRLLGHLRLAT